MIVLPALKLSALALFSTTVSPAPCAPPSMTLFSAAPSLRVSVSSPAARSMVPLPLTVPDTSTLSLPALPV
ncbi:hypothetical protein D3C81_2065900 [compost metagenome]